MKPITNIVNFIKCTVKTIKTYPQCAGYYLFDIVIYLLYYLCIGLWVMLLDYAIGSKTFASLEKQLWGGVVAVDDCIYTAAGFQITKYGIKTMNKCYNCKPKKAKPRKCFLTDSSNGGKNGKGWADITFAQVVFYLFFGVGFIKLACTFIPNKTVLLFIFGMVCLITVVPIIMYSIQYYIQFAVTTSPVVQEDVGEKSTSILNDVKKDE